MYFNNVFKHCKVNSIFQCQVSIQSTCYTAAHMQQVSTSKLSLFHLVRWSMHDIQKESKLTTTRISSKLDRTASRCRGGGMGMLLSACPGSVWKWLGVERSPLNGQKAPDKHPGPDGQTDRRTCLNGSNPPRWMQNVMKWWNYQFLATRQTDTHTHTHKHEAKPIHPRIAGCNKNSHIQKVKLY